VRSGSASRTEAVYRKRIRDKHVTTHGGIRSWDLMRTRCTAPDHRDVLWQKVSDNADDDSADVAGAWVVRMQGTMTICMRTAECPRPLPIAY